ncbi:uncharacterized protein Dwil_GK28036 [Drosophila willistoni]|uniref:Uncharacterized protein n=1 Tax=Drosophila willistoni TaxID=7260 RepID=A0A0Q9X1Y3_DROWI|nr:uncharacterized protein Dwil_GK28036 [Drosophila willistoni]
MENPKNNVKKPLMSKPAVRIGIVVLVIHTVCWLGWNATRSVDSTSQSNAHHERLRAALDQK